jgi:hypothetical protein
VADSTDETVIGAIVLLMILSKRHGWLGAGPAT